MVYAAEAYPADRRGTVLGVLQAFSTLGAIVCAGLTPALLSTAFGWRSVYLVGIAPLLILAFARRNLPETPRFIALGDAPKRSRDFFAIWKTPYRRRLIQMGAIWFITYLGTQNAVSFWNEYALTAREAGGPGLSVGEVGRILVLSSLIAMPLVFLSGKLIDVLGRRKGAAIIFGATSMGVFSMYYARDPLLLGVATTIGIFGVSAVLPVLNAYTTELFPTEMRSDAFAWANNLIGRIGYVLSPIAVGWLAERWGWGLAVRPTAIFPLIAFVMILLLLPETANRDIEDTARLT